MKDRYPSFLTPESKPFDPLEIAHQTEEIVSQKKARKYTHFSCQRFYGGISTGYTVGCCLRCVFCWVSWSRDFPFRAGKFYSPEQVSDKLISHAKKRKIQKLRISGGEPTLCPGHLIAVLDLIHETGYNFILETNGLLLGQDPGYVNKLKKYPNIHVRLSLKAATPEGFENRTGGKGEFFDLPLKALENLKKAGISFHVAAMTDPRLMPKKERSLMLRRMNSIGYRDFFEEEHCYPYSMTIKRLENAGFKLGTFP